MRDLTPWHVRVVSGASGTSSNAELHYRINFTQTGTHYLWVRGHAEANSAKNSVHVAFEGNRLIGDSGLPFSSSLNEWEWRHRSETRFTISTPGEYTVTLQKRELGFNADKILITTDADYTPSGEGPAASPVGDGQTPVVATPTISPDGGSHTDSVTVTLASTTTQAVIYYTADGSTPTAASTPYGGPFTLTQSATVKAIALVDGYSDSAIAEAGFTVSANSGGGGGTYQQVSDSLGLVVMEAEGYQDAEASSNHEWKSVGSPSGASSGQAMRVVSGASGTSANAELHYRINFTQTGTHYLWVRGHAEANSAKNSVHVAFEGNRLTGDSGLPFSSSLNEWEWRHRSETRFTISTPGEYTVTLQKRELGFNADKILITTDADYTPSGEGPAASAQGNE